MLHEQIKNNIKESMKAGDKIRLEVMRGMLAAFTNELVANGRKPNEILLDEQALGVIKRMIKKGSKAIPLFKQGNRQDLVNKEEAEIKILESFIK